MGLTGPADQQQHRENQVRPTKLILALFGIATVIGIAPSAQAEPAAADQPGVEESVLIDNAAFLESLRSAGITYTNPDQVISAGRAVCGLVDRGEPALQVISDLKTTNPGFTTDGAAQFAAISAHSYCPHQLAKK